MKTFVSMLQILTGVLLILVIIIQQKGAGLGSAFGADFGMYRTKRGAEKFLFYLTIALSVIFIVLSLIGLAV